MTGLSAAEVQRLLALAEAADLDSDERGRKFEQLLAYVFEAVPGTLVMPNTKNYFGGEQVDLAVANTGGFDGLPDKVLVECKNYAHPLDSKSVGYFLFICLSRGVKLASAGLTGKSADSSYAHSLTMAASAMGCHLVVLTRADLLGLASESDLVALLQGRYLAAFANGGIGA